MKLHGSNNRGGITVNTYKEHLLTLITHNSCSSKQALHINFVIPVIQFDQIKSHPKFKLITAFKIIFSSKITHTRTHARTHARTHTHTHTHTCQTQVVSLFNVILCCLPGNFFKDGEHSDPKKSGKCSAYSRWT